MNQQRDIAADLDSLKLMPHVRKSIFHIATLISIATAIVGTVAGGDAWAVNGEGFFSLDFSSATTGLDVVAVDPATLLPLPPTFHADDEGKYELSALLVLDGDTTNPLGSFDVSGHEDGNFEVVSQLAVAGGADNGLAFFAGLIVGIEITDIDNEEASRLQTTQTTVTAGSAGTPAASPSVFVSTFLGTPDGKEARADSASGGGPMGIPDEITFDSGSVLLPPIPGDSNSDSFNLLIGQIDTNVFNIGPETAFAFATTTTFDVASPLNSADFDGDGDVDGSDFLNWQSNFPTAEGATKINGDADNDGDVDGDDFQFWLQQFSNSGSGQQSIASAPEPTAIALLAAIAIPLTCARQRGSGPSA